MGPFSSDVQDDSTTAVIVGTLRVESSAVTLARRLRAGDIAVVDQMDLDQRSATALAARKPAAVINTQPSITGRYPNRGPAVLAKAGIPLIDAEGRDIYQLRDGTVVRLIDGDVYQGESVVARGTQLSDYTMAQATEQAGAGLTVQLSTFTANAMDSVTRDGATVLDGAGLPALSVDVKGAHVVVVAAGEDSGKQLAALRSYFRDRRPVIIAVGAAAELAHTHAYAPAVIVGSLDGVADKALRAASQIVVHDPDQADAGAGRADALGLAYDTAETGLTSEDVALLLAHHGGAAVVTTVGINAELLDLLEQGGSGAAGTFLTRLQVGGAVVDARTLAATYRSRFSAVAVVALAVSGLLALSVALWATPGGREWIGGWWDAAASWMGMGS